MKGALFLLGVIAVLAWAETGHGENATDGFVRIRPCVNELSLYQNFLDDGRNAGQTLQVISINSVKLRYWFDVEITLDVNRRMDHALNPGVPEPEDYDYYLELGLVKPVVGSLKLNYQRVYGTFVSGPVVREGPVNQIGFRWAF